MIAFISVNDIEMDRKLLIQLKADIPDLQSTVVMEMFILLRDDAQQILEAEAI